MTESSAGSAQQAWPQEATEERRSCGSSAAAEAVRESINGLSREGEAVMESSTAYVARQLWNRKQTSARQVFECILIGRVAQESNGGEEELAEQSNSRGGEGIVHGLSREAALEQQRSLSEAGL